MCGVTAVLGTPGTTPRSKQPGSTPGSHCCSMHLFFLRCSKDNKLKRWFHLQSACVARFAPQNSITLSVVHVPQYHTICTVYITYVISINSVHSIMAVIECLGNSVARSGPLQREIRVLGKLSGPLQREIHGACLGNSVARFREKFTATYVACGLPFCLSRTGGGLRLLD